MKENTKCSWCLNDPLYENYHDNEWGIPLHDDNKLFEFLILESFQAGLSWITILRKREDFRNAFDQFDPTKIAKYTEKDRARLLNDATIVRNRMKIEATINNAKCYLDMLDAGLTLDHFFWSYVEGKPLQNNFKKMSDIPAQTDLSQKISKDLKKKGFKFVGPTTMYAHMQACGMVNDHIVSCPSHAKAQKGYQP